MEIASAETKRMAEEGSGAVAVEVERAVNEKEEHGGAGGAEGAVVAVAGVVEGSNGTEEGSGAVPVEVERAVNEKKEDGGAGGAEGAVVAVASVIEGGNSVTAAPGAGTNGAEEGVAVAAAAPQMKGNLWTCHQCRQRKMEVPAACKKIKTKKAPCPKKYCKKCLLNRYGETVEEVAQEEAWICPSCRDMCNCSTCRKKKGEAPTGQMARAAEASGCSSVHDSLNKGAEAVAAAKKLVAPSEVNGTKKRKPQLVLGADDDNGELLVEGSDVSAVSSVLSNKRLKGNYRVKNTPAGQKCPPRTQSPDVQEEIVLPRGTLVTSIARAELEPEDVGPAIQFLEFCRLFGEIFQIRKGQPEKILQDITGGRELQVAPSLVAELHINLLSVIQGDRKGKPLNSSGDGDKWIINVVKYVDESIVLSKELSDCLNLGVLGYKNLSPSCKLRVLNSLCDEALSSEKVKNWIDKHVEKEASIERVIQSAQKKEKMLKKQLKSATLKKGETPSTEEVNNLNSEIKEAQETKQAAINEKELGGVPWIEPLMANTRGVYWKLDSYCNNATIMCQEFDNENTLGNSDKWFMFTEQEEKLIREHVATRWMDCAS